MMQAELRHRLKGIFVLHATPFTDGLEVDHDGLASNIRRTLDDGAHGIVAGGTYAEYPSLSREERIELFRTAVTTVGGRVPVICCTAASGTGEAIDLSRQASDLGADAVMVTPPYVHEVRPDDVVRHFEALGSAVEIPIMVYHSTSIGVSMAPELLARIAQHPKVMAVKQGATDLHDQVRSLNAVGGNAAMFCGSDGVALASLSLGYAGCTTTLGNFMAAEFVALHREVERGDLTAARSRFSGWQPIRDVMRSVGQPAGVKAAMEILGYAGGGPRLPFERLPVSSFRMIEAAMDAVRSGSIRT